MQISRFDEEKMVSADQARPADKEMQDEYDYILAGQMTKKLLDKGLISVEEFDKIMEENRRLFSPMEVRVSAEKTCGNCGSE